MADTRLEISRLYWRFGFGPLRGESLQGFNQSTEIVRERALRIENQGSLVAEPDVADVGSRPPLTNAVATGAFNTKVRSQIRDLIYWSLDRMALAENPLHEKMTWFWHGHWATSVEKVNFALPMFNQYQTLHKYALGNFKDMAQAMFNDGALQIWLDGQDNIAKAPNENLSREMMELFTLGVGNYTEKDVKELARAFTGFLVARTTGVMTFNLNRHDKNPVLLLGQNIPSDAQAAINILVAQNANQRFIPMRLWYRLISSEHEVDASVISAYTQRDISVTVKALSHSSILSDQRYSMVKSPVEWFIGICRAFGITPSQVGGQSDLVYRSLNKLSQLPFLPPNVGGWPTNEAWLSAASSQFRVTFSNALLKDADLSAIAALPVAQRVEKLADYLGIYKWSSRTRDALFVARRDIPRMVLLAVNSPEYVVSA